MTHGSLFAGIGGFDLGFERAGFRTVWQVENNPFCLAVLATRFPDADRSVTDVREAGKENLAAVDCITAGVPCQDVSVAGKRAGLQGERTGLFFEFARILQELRPAWFVFENVPGLLSSNRGRDFAEVLRVLMVECGYGVCWRVLDSQFFGVAQRRRRVFIVGHFGGPCPAEVLFESKSGAGNPPQGRKAGKGIAHSLAQGSVSSGYRYDPNGEEYVIAGFSAGQSAEAGSLGYREGQSPTLRGSPSGTNQVPTVTAPITASYGEGIGLADEENLIAIQDVRGHREKKQHGIGIQAGGPSYTLGAVERHAVAFNWQSGGDCRINPSDKPDALQRSQVPAFAVSRDAVPKTANGLITDLRSGNPHPSAVTCPPPDTDGVRDPTEIPKGMDDSRFPLLPKGLDSARYRALGNAITVSVAQWIARRIISLGIQT